MKFSGETRFDLRKVLQSVIILVIGAVGLSGCSYYCSSYPNNYFCTQKIFGVEARPHSITQHRTQISRPHFETSTPGVQTVATLAPFFGNLSAISSSEPQDNVALLRQPDCSLTYYDFTFGADATGVDITVNSQIPHYEKTIHSAALLTTIPDVFANGCVDNTRGIASQQAINVGVGKNGQTLGASIGPTNEIYTAGLLSNGTSSIPAIQVTATTAASVVSGDLNKDGNADLVSVNSDGTQSSVTVFLGNADGTYQPGVTYALPGSSAQYAALDDLDGDGNLDILASSSNPTFEFSVLIGNGNGTFKPAQSFSPANTSLFFMNSFITADVNGDHAKDIITSLGQVFLGTGDGTTFTLASQRAFTPNPSAPNPTSVVAADLNKDGKMDLATNDGLAIRTFLGNGDGTFTAGPAYASIPNEGYLVASDLDGDGNIDLISGAGENGGYGGDDFLPNLTYPLMGNGDGTFQGAASLPATYTGSNLADLNHDGHPDLVGFTSVTMNGQTSVVFTTSLGQANGTFRNGPQTPAPPYIGGLGGNNRLSDRRSRFLRRGRL